MSRQLNVVELFSGIGAQMKALKNLNFNINTIATCDWWAYASLAYSLIHRDSEKIYKKNILEKEKIVDLLYNNNVTINGKDIATKNSLKMLDISTLNYIYNSIKETNNLCDIRSINGSTFPNKIDLLTYSFPCQDLSSAGNFFSTQTGLDPTKNSRSSLLWEVGRILTEMKNSNNKLPKYLLMENVPDIINKHNKPLFDKWIDTLSNLGYISKYFILKATDFGLPQTRKRCFMISIQLQERERERERERDCAEVQNFLHQLTENKILSDYKNSKYYKPRKIIDLLRINNNDDSLLFKEELDTLMSDTKSHNKMIELGIKIIDQYLNVTSRKGIRTLTTSQDKHPNAGIIYFNRKYDKKTNFRLLTPRECFLFQGFEDKDFEKLYYNNINRTKDKKLFNKRVLWKLAGNSIAVPVLEAIFLQIEKLEELYATFSNKYNSTRDNS